MDIVQLVALAVGILTLVWHQQRSVAALRAEFKAEIAELRAEVKAEIAELHAEFKAEIAALRAEFKAEIAELRAELKQDVADVRVATVDNGQRLSRIEGYFGIGMAPEAAAAAAGVRLAAPPAGTTPAAVGTASSS